MHIEPGYIRFVMDGLEKADISKDNVNSLPEGMTGFYESELFTPSMSIGERTRTLRFFLPFAFTQGGISADFASLMLSGSDDASIHPFAITSDVDPSDDDIVRRMFSRYSRWFTSPAPGRFGLFHDRFRAYILQRNQDRALRGVALRLLDLLENYDGEGIKGEIIAYSREFLLYHHSSAGISGIDVMPRLVDLLSSDEFLRRSMDERTDASHLLSGYRLCIDLAMNKGDWSLLRLALDSMLRLKNLVSERVQSALRDADSEWSALYGHFRDKADSVDRARFLFLACMGERVFSDRLFQSMCEGLSSASFGRSLDLSVIAPLWLVDRVRSLSAESKALEPFFRECDASGLGELSAMQPDYMFFYEDQYGYPNRYSEAYESLYESLAGLEDSSVERFKALFDSIDRDDLIYRDEVVTRATDAHLDSEEASPHVVDWFYWLVDESEFEVGHHSPDRLNTIGLCTRHILRSDTRRLDRLSASIASLHLENESKLRLYNLVSQRYRDLGEIQKSMDVMISSCAIPEKGTFDGSAWLRSWILLDSPGRAVFAGELDAVDALDVSFSIFDSAGVHTVPAFLRHDLFARLSRLDGISKSEFMAEYAVKLQNTKSGLSVYMIREAWNAVSEREEWLSLLAKISVLSASLGIMADPWVLDSFDRIRKNVEVHDDDGDLSFHLEETLFSTGSGRFGASGRFQEISSRYPPIARYLKKRFRFFYDRAVSRIRFQRMLAERLNGFSSFSSFWKSEKGFFGKKGPGCGYSEFWDAVRQDTRLFGKFTIKDVRVLNSIATTTGARFPFERFVHLNVKVQRYSSRFRVPDEYGLGLSEGFYAMARFRDRLESDQGYRTVLSGSLKGRGRRFVGYDWVSEPIQPVAYAAKKCLSFGQDVKSISEYLALRERLIGLVRT